MSLELCSALVFETLFGISLPLQQTLSLRSIASKAVQPFIYFHVLLIGEMATTSFSCCDLRVLNVSRVVSVPLLSPPSRYLAPAKFLLTLSGVAFIIVVTGNR